MSISKTWLATLSRNARSCVAMSTAMSPAATVLSSHSMAKKSRWFVGSSSSSTSGLRMSADASATRFLSPPERSDSSRCFSPLMSSPSRTWSMYVWTDQASSASISFSALSIAAFALILSSTRWADEPGSS
mmetsp:Transcript_9093/g.26176  ORF Transcript_9093/g.26176 Transcript_9093/m.26176 type:complete len:131 (+) Transcript_9093:504-896(+)